MEELIGYTLFAKKTIGGFFENGIKKDEFNGCKFGMIIIFTDGTGVRCMTYNYEYAYMPEAFLFSNGTLMKMCADDELYDVGNVR